MQQLEESIGINLCGLGLGNGFLGKTPTLWATKEKKIHNLGFIKILKKSVLQWPLSRG